ncbi:ribonuclease HI family protein [candidate division WWE3 bacterium]|nr:ribonuclease HI family protein [candidate division WWE3 bacterium]
MKLILHTDGGARGNPGPSAAGIVIENESGEVVRELGIFLGHCTNNEAEYQALIHGIKTAQSLGADRLSCFLDSELVVKQVNGLYKVKNTNMKALNEKVTKLKPFFKEIDFTHVPREKNEKADKLVNEVLDASK